MCRASSYSDLNSVEKCAASGVLLFERRLSECSLQDGPLEMSSVDDRDLGRFRYAGFDAPVGEAEHPSSRQLFESAARVLESPAARLMKAVYCTVVKLAERGDLSESWVGELSEQARRRLGYTVERAARSDTIDPDIRGTLAEFADVIHRPKYRHEPPLTVTANATDSYLRILQERGDGVNERWHVYGDVAPLH